jgi:two-component system, cell cycle response regulator
MTRVLTVDDSRAIRSIVQKQLADCGMDIDEAEDGEKGLDALSECLYDLVILDVTMPVMDGPTMLAKMREKGLRTPVLMLTSESKRSIIAACLKLGIDDYIHKPFKPEELRSKVFKALGRPAPAMGAAAAPAAPPAAAPDQAPSADPTVAAPPLTGTVKTAIDVLVVDDMENVHKKLRTLLPAAITSQSATSAPAALAVCRERHCKVILVDTDIPDVNSIALMNQLRALQGQAVILAMPLRGGGDPEKDAKDKGFDGCMPKPFLPDSVQDFLLKYFASNDMLTAEENVLKVGSYAGKDDRLDRFYGRVLELSRPALEHVAAACFDEAILDLTLMPLSPERTARAVMEVDKQAKKLGLSLRLAGTPELCKLLTAFTETAAIPFYPTVDAARSAA